MMRRDQRIGRAKSTGHRSFLELVMLSCAGRPAQIGIAAPHAIGH
jgi:hypothetical protein